jgi:hypothetical protein
MSSRFLPFSVLFSPARTTAQHSTSHTRPLGTCHHRWTNPLWGLSQLKQQSNVAISCPSADWKLPSPLFPFSQTPPEQGHQPSFLERAHCSPRPRRGTLFAAGETKGQNVRDSEHCILQRAIAQCAGTGCSAARATVICSFSKSRFWSCTSLFSLLPGCCSAIYQSFVRSPWGRTRNNLPEPTRRPHSLRHRWRGGPAVPRTSLCAASRRVAQHSKQRTTSSASTTQLPAAQIGLHLGDFAASCCLVLSGRCSSGVASRAKKYPRYLATSTLLLSSASTPPYQARSDRYPPNPPSPNPPASRLISLRCITVLFRYSPVLPNLFFLLPIPHPHHAPSSPFAPTLPDQSLIHCLLFRFPPASSPKPNQQQPRNISYPVQTPPANSRCPNLTDQLRSAA